MHEIFLAAHKRFLAFKKEFNKKHPKMKHKQKLKYPNYKARFLEHSRVQGLFNNILTAIRTISNQKPVLNRRKTTEGKDLIEYCAAYSIQQSGRVSEIHGGFQSLYTPCKWLLLEGVANIYNYDMKNAQAVILADELRKSGHECKWLEDYLKDPDMKEILARKIGISVDCWKDCFYATIMGAETGPYGAIFKSIREEETDQEKAEVKHSKFIKEIQKLLNACDKWREHLLWGMSKRYMYKHREFHWRNACDMEFRDNVAVMVENGINIIDSSTGEVIESERKLNKLKRKLAAFFLQGKEAFFIHNLTLECVNKGIPVYKNEHDGIITGKRIPSRVIAKVAKEIGIPEIMMDIKEICKEGKRRKFEKFLEM
jgi:hypothetical protein